MDHWITLPPDQRPDTPIQPGLIVVRISTRQRENLLNHQKVLTNNRKLLLYASLLCLLYRQRHDTIHYRPYLNHNILNPTLINSYLPPSSRPTYNCIDTPCCSQFSEAMAASSTKTATASKDRRKSGNTITKASLVRAASTTPEKASSKPPSRMITLKVDAQKLRAIVDPESLKKEDTPVKEDVKESPATSTTLPVTTNSVAENPSDSNPPTPAASGTPIPQPMGPPVEGPKKKGVKRAANGTGEPKARGRPGPKKKQRL